MSSNWKPPGYTSVSPYLITTRAQGVIDFLKATFGADELRRHDSPDGRIMHAEVRVGDSVVMLADATDDWPAVPSHIHVYVEDADATYHAALQAGGKSIQEPKQREGDPDRRGGVLDPAGNSWWIATQR